MDREKLKELIRNAPTIEATFAEIDAEFQGLVKALGPLQTRRAALLSQMAQVAAARAEFEAPVQNKTGEPAPASQPAAKPSKQGNKK